MSLTRVLRCTFTLATILSCTPKAPAQAPAAPTFHDAALEHTLDNLLSTPGMDTGIQGVRVESLRDGAALYDRNGDRLFIPASNNKLLTCSAALALLDADYRYHTRLVSAVVPDSRGRLRGDLVLVGSGDPTLTAADIERMAWDLRAAGVRRVDGAIGYDDSRFDRRWLGDSWTWDDESAYYSAQISALNADENVVTVRVRPGAIATAPVSVSIAPTQHYVTVLCTARTSVAGSARTLDIVRDRGTNVIVITGSLAADGAGETVPVTIEDPARFAGTLLSESLRRAGIAVRHPAPVRLTAPAVTTPLLVEHVSQPLPALINRLLKPSDNLMAECLLKTLGAANAVPGTAAGGVAACRRWQIGVGLYGAELSQVDGSGLSRQDLVSPHNLVRLLRAMHDRPDFQTFYDALPIAGVDGTLRRRMLRSLAAGNCHAKTGSLTHVSALSGYVATRDGEMLVFSIMMNNQLAPGSACTSVQDAIVELLAGYARPHASNEAEQ